MKRRLFSLLLAVVLLVSTVAVSAPTVFAEGEMKASDKIIDLIKSFEGFSAEPYEDNGQYTIGYGTRCDDPEDYPNGITKEKAEELLKEAVAQFETSVNNFAKDYKVKLSQNQFDALVSFTYNLGASWLREKSIMRSAVLNGDTGNDFLYAITMYCNASGKILKNLINRRLIEANVYLNGVYSTTVPTSYDYVLFNTQMEEASGTVKIQGYDSSWNTEVVPSPTRNGYRFLGWYTKATGGEWVTNLTADHAGDTLYGHWQKGNGSAAGTAASYKHVTTRETPVCDAPNGKVVKKLDAKTTIAITADYMDDSGVKWGKTKDGWVSLSTTRTPSGAVMESDKTVKVVVNTDGVNIRKGPGTNYARAGKANEGDELTITEVQRGVNYLWGKFSEGWICLDYTNYEEVLNGTASNPEKTDPIRGKIIKTDKLNIRNKPGTTGTTVVGSYKRDDIVTITAQQKVGKTTWGQTNKGWISLYYVDLNPVDADSKDEADKDDDKTDTGKVTATGVIINTDKLNIRNKPGTTGTTVVGTYERGDVVTITTQQKVGKTTWGQTKKGWISLYYVELSPVDNGPTDPNDKVMATGYITDCITLRVRQGPGTTYRKVGSLAAGTEVKIYETTGSGHNLWGRISGGWISMNYVELDVGASESGDGKVGVVYNCDKLNVRSGAGTDNRKVARLDSGTKVEVFETKKVKDVLWGRISLGWVSMEYIKLTEETEPETDKPETDEPEKEEPETEKPGGTTTTTARAGTVVDTTELRVRAGAGTQYDKVDTLKKGDRIIVQETVKVGTATWGRIDKGWVHMHYVELDTTEVPAGAVYRTVTTELRIRAGAGTNYTKVGSYEKGEVVLIYEQTRVNKTLWGRTDKGWISLDYVK